MREGGEGEGEGDSNEGSGGWNFRVVPTNVINQVTYEGIRRRPISREPRNCGSAEEASSLKELNKEKKGKKEILHKARPKLMLFAVYLHIYT